MMAIPRHIEPEWLDSLPASDPRALRSRRDLVKLNVLMFHARIVARALARHSTANPLRAIMEIGAGDGKFMLSVARRLAPLWPRARIILLDRQHLATGEIEDSFAKLGWKAETIQADVFDFLDHVSRSGVDAIIANLFLHHFEDEDLRRLFSGAARSVPLFVACEPHRAALPLFASRVLWTIGCNDVTRHDAPASVRAGFKGKELSRLWPGQRQWDLHERRAGLFSHCFVARHAQ